MDRFNLAGLCIALSGLIFASLSYVILSNTPLTALGISAAILGFSIAITPISPIPPKAVRSMLEEVLASSELILEWLNVGSRGYYRVCDDRRIYVYIPLSGGGPPSVAKPRGLIFEDGGYSYLALPSPVSGLIDLDVTGRIESTLEYILVDLTELCESVSIVEAGLGYTVEFRKPRSPKPPGRVGRVLGSLEACIAASTIALATGRPVSVASEEDSDGRRIAFIEVYR
ncbi:MAG: hypothetical protein N3E44_02980 [Candidatus Bathyarchaeota archaeon]|nr:hypothetical protein [Candidatus Bathyarchaeota archaeon]